MINKNIFFHNCDQFLHTPKPSREGNGLSYDFNKPQ